MKKFPCIILLLFLYNKDDFNRSITKKLYLFLRVQSLLVQNRKHVKIHIAIIKPT